MPAKNNAVWKTQNIWNETRETLAKRDTLIVFDLETTGLSRVNDRIIQIAAIRYGIDSDMNLTEQCTYWPGTCWPRMLMWRITSSRPLVITTA